jgi:hypothetical protein
MFLSENAAGSIIVCCRPYQVNRKEKNRGTELFGAGGDKGEIHFFAARNSSNRNPIQHLLLLSLERMEQISKKRGAEQQ